MITFADATSNATTDIAYFVCIISFLIAAGVAIYLLWDKIEHTSNKHTKRGNKSKSATTKPAGRKTTPKKTAVKPVTTKKKSVKKTVKKPAKK